MTELWLICTLKVAARCGPYKPTVGREVEFLVALAWQAVEAFREALDGVFDARLQVCEGDSPVEGDALHPAVHEAGSRVPNERVARVPVVDGFEGNRLRVLLSEPCTRVRSGRSTSGRRLC